MCKKRSLLVDGLCDVRETIGGGALVRGEEAEPDGWRVGVDRYIFIWEQDPWICYLPTKPKSQWWGRL